ncbi:unnamed protein product [Rotaria magnacalcarata]|uniref:Uncharacterized protein n=2 Tax=Rotaria magnacalcarata TaxID=392030 RepID=A0A816TLY4_9BILA|nr:unnamed protein product [Rotaria magnacalcarata]CAF2098280.1 unnamed protein product [Rotaria magnacalcarata]CAF4002923.1 unnamed protein product [Rotaria magnacalcarata]CAF4136749.1 unnamed protein product [Rotaria magnacalcarata]
MSEIKISSTGWLALYLENDNVLVFDLNDTSLWQCLEAESAIDDNSNDLHRNQIKFSPNGQFLVVNRPNKHLYISIQSDYDKSGVYWLLKQIIRAENSILALTLTDEILLIGDSIGDIYKFNLLFNSSNEDRILTAENNRIIRNSSMLLDIIFFRMSNKKSFVITADRENKICLNDYLNISDNLNYCFGHNQFVSHIKLIDNNRILSASGDGTLRLWHVPDCMPLAFVHSKALTLQAKQVFFTGLYALNNSASLAANQKDVMPECIKKSSSTVNDSIWKMDVACSNPLISNVYIVFSTYARRYHSIYLSSLSNMKQLNNEQRELIFDPIYGGIIDYCFPAQETFLNDYTTHEKYFLYVLFNTNVLVQVDILAMLSHNQTALFVQANDRIQEINYILANNEFNLVHKRIKKDALIFEELFENSTDSNNNCHRKRISETFEEQENRKKQALS